MGFTPADVCRFLCDPQRAPHPSPASGLPRPDSARARESESGDVLLAPALLADFCRPLLSFATLRERLDGEAPGALGADQSFALLAHPGGELALGFSTPGFPFESLRRGSDRLRDVERESRRSFCRRACFCHGGDVFFREWSADLARCFCGPALPAGEVCRSGRLDRRGVANHACLRFRLSGT